jgi:hypothetical protein
MDEFPECRGTKKFFLPAQEMYRLAPYVPKIKNEEDLLFLVF